MINKYFFLLQLVALTTFGQGFDSSNVVFSIYTGVPLQNMTGSTQVLGPNILDNPSILTSFPSGFTFEFNGQSYNSFSVSPDGFLRLGAQGIAQPTDNLNSTTNYPIIAPYWSDMSTSSNGYVSYLLVGTIPNRKLVLHWRIYHNFALEDFQVWLYEKNGVFDFVYGPMLANSSTYSVGLAGSFGNNNSFGSITTTNPITNSFINYTITNPSNTFAIPGGTAFSFRPDTIAPAGPKNLLFNPVFASCLALSWRDSSTTEQFFELFRSTDSVNYTLLSRITSDSIPTMGAIYTYFDTNRIPSTRYYYQITAAGIVNISPDTLIGDTVTSAPLLSGIKAIPGDYSTISDALDDIKCKQIAAPLFLELQPGYSSSTESFPLVIDPLIRTSGTQTLTVRPSLTAANCQITSTLSSQLFLLDSAEYFYLDGRPGGTVNSIELTLSNTSSVGKVVLMQNDVSHVGISYCKISGSNGSGTSGLVVIGSTIYTSGNDSISFDSCVFQGLIPVPANLLYSNGHLVKTNDGISVRRCSFLNFTSTSTNTSAGLRVENGNSGWIIRNNHFYQDPANPIPAFSAGFHLLKVNSRTGGGFRIDSNYFGGNAPYASGLKYQVSSPQMFLVSTINTGYSLQNSFIGNTYRNFYFSNNPNFGGNLIAFLDSGSYLVENNVIGSMDTTSSIECQHTTNSSNGFTGFSLGHHRNSVVRNNSIGGINISGTNVEFNFNGMGVYGENMLIENNNVGSQSVPNSISIGCKGTVRCLSTVFTRGQNRVRHNTICNVRRSSIESSIYGNEFRGMSLGVTLNGSRLNSFIHVDSNKVFSLSHNGRFIKIIGIAASTQDSMPLRVIGNSVYSLSDYTVFPNGGFIGIILSNFMGPDAPLTVENNFIHSFHLDNSTSSGPNVHGLEISSDYSMFVTNNMIQLGYDSAGQQGVRNCLLYAMICSGFGFKSIKHNTISVNGWSSANLVSCCLLVGNTSNGVSEIHNNIFQNTRTDLAGSTWAINYPPANNIAAWSINNNIFHVTGVNGVIHSQYPTLASWQAYSNKDINSLPFDPVLVNPTGNYAQIDLHLGNGTGAEGVGNPLYTSAIDFDGDIRSIFSPVDIGADAGNYIPLYVESTEEGVFDVFPNPSSDRIILRFNESRANKVEIVDLSGRVLKYFDLNGTKEHTIDISALPEGLYFVKLLNEGNWLTIKPFSKIN